MRGERTRSPRPGTSYSGSAPRARGTALAVADAQVDIRFSPACAGNGPFRRRRSVRRSVQPRVRGERVWLDRRIDRGHGSAPRARGTAQRLRRATVRGRFSPACAGNGCGSGGRRRSQPVQPRVRGERELDIVPGLHGGGSAPRARGTDHGHDVEAAVERFSPACAGNGQPARRR